MPKSIFKVQTKCIFMCTLVLISMHINIGHGGGENLCIYPGCLRTKYQEGSRLHDFCGRKHATMFAQEQRKSIANY